LQLITILKPSIIDSIDDPPYDMMGSGAPTIGNSPRTMAIFTKIYKNKADAKPKQYSFAKNDLQEKPILIIL
jgi:hypothetical protein